MTQNIARWTMAHRRIVVVAWIIAAVGIFAAASSVGKKTASDFTPPGTGTQHAVDLLKSRFPAQAGDADQIVFHARAGTLSDAADRATIDATLARVARLPHVTSVVSPYAPGAARRSPVTARSAFATVELRPARRRAAQGGGGQGDRDGRGGALGRASRSSSGGRRSSRRSRPRSGFATVVGIAAAIIILLLSFGSFTAMGLPIATALLGLGAGVGADHARQPRRRHARLRLRAGADDRPRRRRRLRAVHRHALPRELPQQRRRRASRPSRPR